jgi:hypothetical protein
LFNYFNADLDSKRKLQEHTSGVKLLQRIILILLKKDTITNKKYNFVN